MTQALMRHQGSQETQTNKIVVVGLFKSLNCAKFPGLDRTSSLEHMGV